MALNCLVFDREFIVSVRAVGLLGAGVGTCSPHRNVETREIHNQWLFAHVPGNVHLVGGFHEALPRAKDLLHATLLGDARELHPSLCDDTERQARMDVPAGIAVDVHGNLMHGHVGRIR
jgi:hypothetical protein